MSPLIFALFSALALLLACLAFMALKALEKQPQPLQPGEALRLEEEVQSLNDAIRPSQAPPVWLEFPVWF